MTEFVFTLPDLGEGMVEVEIVQWHVSAGAKVTEGDPMVDVMTDKANVEVPSPVSGTVLRTSGGPGDSVAVGAELIAFETNQTTPSPVRPIEPVRKPSSKQEPKQQPEPTQQRMSNNIAESSQPHTAKVITSPAIRRHAKEAGIDLSNLAGTGPRGRITRLDLDAAVTNKPQPAATTSGVGHVEEIKVIGVRRVIANRLQASTREIPHFTYVEEIDVTALESLRARLNDKRAAQQPNLTYLPFIALALIRALRKFPQCNAHFDSERGLLKRYHHVHLGIATQTDDGLKVAVVHNAGARDLWGLATEISRLAAAARDNTARRSELMGSTFTLTSLGSMGGIVTTPIINAPEVGILGINKAVKRPVVIDDNVVVRLMMNLSSSFDHRFVDGYDAAAMIQALKGYLEEPATIFID